MEAFSDRVFAGPRTSGNRHRDHRNLALLISVREQAAGLQRDAHSPEVIAVDSANIADCMLEKRDIRTWNQQLAISAFPGEGQHVRGCSVGDSRQHS